MSEDYIDKIDRLEIEREEAVEEALAAARTHQRAGRIRETASILDKVLSFDPENIEALTGMAEISAISKQPLAALPIYSKILLHDPENINALTNRGVALMQIGDAEASEVSFSKVVRLYPEDIDGLNNLGTCLIEQNKFDDAERYLIKATELAPTKAQSFYNLGVLFSRSTPDDTPTQLRHFEKALELNPEHAEACVNIANIYSKNGDNKKSLQFLEKALLARPDDPIILFNKGITLRLLKQFDDAIDCFKVIRSKLQEPHLVDYEIGNAHREAGNLKESIAFLVASVSERKNFKPGFIALGKSLAESGQIAKAKDAFARAGSDSEAQQLTSALNLLTGDEDPWKVFSEIFDTEALSICSAEKKWKGEKGTKALAIHTIGMPEGEIILLSRLVSSLISKVGKITIIVTKPMAQLISCLGLPATIVIETDFRMDMLDDDARHAHLNSIPPLLGLKEGSLPYNGRYIEPEKERARLWESSVFDRNEMNIGLCWNVNGVLSGPNQQLQMEEYEPVIELQGAHFINLTPARSNTRKGHLRDFDVTDLGDSLRDHEDLLAAIDRLDLLVTSDLLSAHLAGALNKKAIVLLPLFPNWHWGYKAQEALYYPNTVLMRQSISNNWDRAIQKTRAFLKEQFGLE